MITSYTSNLDEKDNRLKEEISIEWNLFRLKMWVNQYSLLFISFLHLIVDLKLRS